MRLITSMLFVISINLMTGLSGSCGIGDECGACTNAKTNKVNKGNIYRQKTNDVTNAIRNLNSARSELQIAQRDYFETCVGMTLVSGLVGGAMTCLLLQRSINRLHQKVSNAAMAVYDAQFAEIVARDNYQDAVRRLIKCQSNVPRNECEECKNEILQYKRNGTSVNNRECCGGNLCPDGKVCLNGRCVCPNNQATCNNDKCCKSASCCDANGCCSNGGTCCPGSGCVDLKTDNNNCGICDRACGNGKQCCNGTCQDIKYEVIQTTTDCDGSSSVPISNGTSSTAPANIMQLKEHFAMVNGVRTRVNCSGQNITYGKPYAIPCN